MSSARSALASTLLAVCLGGTALMAAAGARAAPPAPFHLDGRWDGVLRADEFSIAFPFEISGRGRSVQGAFFNGAEPVVSTRGEFAGRTLTLHFDHYATELSARLEGGVLRGTYGKARTGRRPIELRPHGAVPAGGGSFAPNIAGVWILPHESAKGEHAWRFVVTQAGTTVSAAILRVDGDSGLLSGSFRDGEFLLEHFDGSRGYSLRAAPRADGALDLSLRGLLGPAQSFTAVRADLARTQGLPEPSDPATHTRMQDPAEAFRFSFPDLDGRLVSNTDARFQGKVVVVNVTGSWCPNCHDEAPFLAGLDRRYRGLGLEVVALSFEEPEQLADLTRLRAFVRHYGIGYTYLVAGEPSQVKERLPQADHLDAWPTTFFLGRDGRVRAVHTGFPGRASGEFHEQAVREITATVERLLAETP